MKECLNCGIEFEPKRKDAKYCSPNCRVTHSRKKGIVTDNVTLSDPVVTDNFEFTIKHKPLNPEFDDEAMRQSKATVRTAKYYYQVPLAAIPVIKKGWPSMPDYMNGRQYFLWWKNNFEVNDSDDPVILNPVTPTKVLA